MANQENDLWELNTRSEAVYLDAVTNDGASGFIARTCRFPDEGLAWNWLHIFHHGHVHSFTSHEVSCAGGRVDESAERAAYEAGDFHFTRSGDRLSPESVIFTAGAHLNSGPLSPHGEGVLPAQVSASFQAGLPGFESMSGRSEVLGITDVRMTLGDAEIELETAGQFHEQIQTTPRFDKPFTYGTLRGDTGGCIFARGVRGATGSVVLNDERETITTVRIAPPNVIRPFEIDLESGRTIKGEAVATYQYEIPVFHMVRPGTLVSATIDGHKLSGCINDLAFGDLTYDL
jgi:hypothetical protein